MDLEGEKEVEVGLGVAVVGVVFVELSVDCIKKRTDFGPVLELLERCFSFLVNIHLVVFLFIRFLVSSLQHLHCELRRLIRVCGWDLNGC